jgi:hypothetical protein
MNKKTAPTDIVSARKLSGVSSCRESFIMGQFMPHMSVNATIAQSCLALNVCMVVF